MTEPGDERETIIRIDYGDRTVHVYSTQVGWWTACARLGMTLETLDVGAARWVNIIGKEYSAPLASTRPGVSLGSLVTHKIRKSATGSGVGDSDSES